MVTPIEDELKAKIDAALFMSSEPISLRQLAKIVGRRSELVARAIQEFKDTLDVSHRGVYLLENSQGYQLKVKPEFVSIVRPLTPYQDLSRGLLRVLALIAYKQPITQSEVVKVIGNRAYAYVKKLETRGLIGTIKQGRTKALVATKEFANYFGLEDVNDLRKFFEDMAGGENSETGINQPRSDVSSERTETTD
jgi:segregation and condensation protein B